MKSTFRICSTPDQFFRFFNSCIKVKFKQKYFLNKVKQPELYGVAKINSKNKILYLKEKPRKFISDKAITGLYFFDNRVIEFSNKLKKSKRGEFEIIDLLITF